MAYSEALNRIYRNLKKGEKYGSSANPATKRDLTWIIRTIFRTTPAEFERKYITESAFLATTESE